MKALIISILVLASTPLLFSQNARINCIIFIDGKLPTGIYNGFFNYNDVSGSVKKIDFDYMIGEILVSHENKKVIDSLQPITEISMNFSYRMYNGQTFSYSGILKVSFLTYNYLVIRITNLNKKKGEYYFGYSTPEVSKKFIRQEYDMFEKY